MTRHEILAVGRKKSSKATQRLGLAFALLIVLGMAVTPGIAVEFEDLGVTGEFGVGPNVGKDDPLRAPIDVYWPSGGLKMHARSLTLTEIGGPVDLRFRSVNGDYPNGPIGPLQSGTGIVPGHISWDILTLDGGYRQFSGVQGVGGQEGYHPPPTAASHPGWLTFFCYPENWDVRVNRVIVDHTGAISLGGGGYGGDGLPVPSRGVHVFGGGFRLQALQAPPAPRLTVVGQPAGVSYTYQIIACDSKNNQSAPSPPAHIIGPSTLDAANYIQVKWDRCQGGETFWILRNGQRLDIDYRGEGAEKVFNDTGYGTASFEPLSRNKSADAEIDGAVIAKQGVNTPAVCLAPQVDADQHNYNPQGLDSSPTMVLNAANAVRMTGLQAPSTDGRWLLLVNNGSSDITLVNDSAESEDQNRFQTGTGSDFVLQPNQATHTVYTLNRWRFIALPQYDVPPPPDTTPPGPVTNFSAATGGSQAVQLSWTNPTDADFAGTMVRQKSSGYPTSPTDGALVCDRDAAPGSTDSYTHSGLGNRVHYYTAFARDEVPNYSSAPASAQGSAAPGCSVTWIESFDSYVDGNLGGQGNWTTTGAASAQVQSAITEGGTGKSVLMDTIASGLAIANRIDFPPKATGYHYLSLDVAQDAGGTAGQTIAYVTFYASDAATEIARLQIKKSRLLVDYYSGSAILTTSAASLPTWYTIRVGFDIDARNFDLWLDGAPKGTNFTWKGSGADISSIVISSERNTSLNPQRAYIDNLMLDWEPRAVSQITDAGDWTPSLSKLRFSFTPASCANEYQYAIGTTSGGTNVRTWTSCGLATDILATGLSLVENQSYFVTVQAGTGHGTWSPSVTTNGIKVAPGVGIQQAKGLPDGASNEVKALRGKIVSAVFPGFFYIQNPIGPGVSHGPSGIKILSSATVQPGDEVDVCGVMRGSGGERYLDCTGNATFIGPGEAPGPLVFSSSALGGRLLNQYTPGVVGGVGPNNIGLYVRIFGEVTQRRETDPKYYYVDDGCGLKDGTTTGSEDNVGVRVSGDPASYPAGSYVVVNGISSCFDDAGQLKRQIVPVSVEVIVP